MCLNVQYVPANKQAGLVVKCYKQLHPYLNLWITSIMGFPVVDGWLFARKPVEKVYHNDWLGAEVVHSYVDNSYDYQVGYAIGVIGYNMHPTAILDDTDDLECLKTMGSLALYLPDTQILSNDSVMAKINRVLESPHPNKTMLYGIHTTLTKLLKRYW